MEKMDPLVDKKNRYAAARRVTVVGAVFSVALAIGKVAAGLIGNSPVMVADGVHSASDLVADAIVMVGMRLGQAQPDEEHPYGHGKFETLTTLFLAIVLFIVAIGIIFDVVMRLQDPHAITPPGMIALIAAILSVLTKEGLYHYTFQVGKRHNAKSIMANAWHHRSDAVSSLAAVAGISGAMMGMPLLDPVAAVAVAFIVGKMGLELARESMRELSDAAIDREIHQKIAALVTSLPEVISAHFLKGRQMGPDILLDVHIEVHPYISVSEGHQIAERVRFALIQEIKAINDVQVHVDTLDDHAELFPVLPSRRELLPLLEAAKSQVPGIKRIDRFTPFYLPKGVVVDISISLDEGVPLEQFQTIANRFVAELTKIQAVHQVLLHLFLADSHNHSEERRVLEWVQGRLQ